MSEAIDYKQLANEMFQALAEFFRLDGHAYFCRNEEHAAYAADPTRDVAYTTERCIKGAPKYRQGLELFGLQDQNSAEIEVARLRLKLAEAQRVMGRKDAEAEDQIGLLADENERLRSQLRTLGRDATALTQSNQALHAEVAKLADGPAGALQEENRQLKRLIQLGQGPAEDAATAAPPAAKAEE